jgi:transcription-repair coupling factor (superfamily II helicase)
MYIKLLNEAILEEKGESPKEKTECTITVNTDAYLPDSYISSSSQRMALYKKISHIENARDVEDLYDELCDRYGEPPLPALYLLDASLLRARASACGITAITQDGTEVRIHPAEFDVEIWSELSDVYRSKLRVVLAANPYLTLKLRTDDDVIGTLCELFEKYLQISANNAGQNGK